MAEGRDYFEWLYQRHSGDIRRFLGRRLAPDDIEDVLAEVFVVAWRRVGDAPGEDRAVVWLYAIARRVLSNEHRRAHRARNLVDHVTAQPGSSTTADPAHAVVDQQQVAAAFADLQESDRDVLRLVAWEQLSSSEVAAVLDCGRTTAAMRINRARRRLLAALRNHELPEEPATSALGGVH